MLSFYWLHFVHGVLHVSFSTEAASTNANGYDTRAKEIEPMERIADDVLRLLDLLPLGLDPCTPSSGSSR